MTHPTDPSHPTDPATGTAPAKVPGTRSAGAPSLTGLLETFQAWSGRNVFVTAERRALARGEVEQATALRQIIDRKPASPSPVQALTAQHELSSLLAVWEWHTVRAARDAGASWAEIARATDTDPEQARAAYLDAIDRQERAARREGGWALDDAEGYHAAAGRWYDELHPHTPDEVVEDIEGAIARDDVDELDALRAAWWNPDHRPHVRQTPDVGAVAADQPLVYIQHSQQAQQEDKMPTLQNADPADPDAASYDWTVAAAEGRAAAEEFAARDVEAGNHGQGADPETIDDRASNRDNGYRTYTADEAMAVLACTLGPDAADAAVHEHLARHHRPATPADLGATPPGAVLDDADLAEITRHSAADPFTGAAPLTPVGRVTAPETSGATERAFDEPCERYPLPGDGDGGRWTDGAGYPQWVDLDDHAAGGAADANAEVEIEPVDEGEVGSGAPTAGAAVGPWSDFYTDDEITAMGDALTRHDVVESRRRLHDHHATHARSQATPGPVDRGVTVDTTHIVATDPPGPAAPYVGISRGRESSPDLAADPAAAADPAVGWEMPGWMREQAARAEAEWAAAGTAPPSRPDDPAELAARVAALREQIAARDTETPMPTVAPLVVETSRDFGSTWRHCATVPDGWREDPSVAAAARASARNWLDEEHGKPGPGRGFSNWTQTRVARERAGHDVLDFAGTRTDAESEAVAGNHPPSRADARDTEPPTTVAECDRPVEPVPYRTLVDTEQQEARREQLTRWHTDDVRREALEIRAEVRDLHC